MPVVHKQAKLSPLLPGTKYEIYVQAVAGERVGMKSKRSFVDTPAEGNYISCRSIGFK